MTLEERIPIINEAVSKYFQDNPDIDIILAKDIMPQFIAAGAFKKDNRKGSPIRNVLRELNETNALNEITQAHGVKKKKNINWFFIKSADADQISPQKTDSKTKKSGRENSDEHYVIDLCDEVLQLKASRQHNFDFLKGDLWKNGKRRSYLPVDGYYKKLNLVVEFMERQHTESVAIFDKPNVMTISGVSRKEQRKLYDQRRVELIPKHEIDLITISYTDFEFNKKKKIIRNKEHDLQVVRNFLKKYLP